MHSMTIAAGLEGKLRVFVTSFDVSEGGWQDCEANLKRCWESSDKRYELVEDPDVADLILLGDYWELKRGHVPRSNALIRRWPDKCFVISYEDKAVMLHHGIYSSGTKSIAARQRIRNFSYSLYPQKFLNPFVSQAPVGAECAPKDYLMSFVGRRCHPVRDELLGLKYRRPDVCIADSSASFELWKDGDNGTVNRGRQQHYCDTIRRSKFSLCPRGSGANSIRLFESMQLGVAPVIIADDWLLPMGPRWADFAIFVPERHVRKIEAIVIEREADFHAMGQRARQAYHEFFADDVCFNYVVDCCLDIRAKRERPPKPWVPRSGWRRPGAGQPLFAIRRRARLTALASALACRSSVR
jgi:hypothetical protein